MLPLILDPRITVATTEGVGLPVLGLMLRQLYAKDDMLTKPRANQKTLRIRFSLIRNGFEVTLLSVHPALPQVAYYRSQIAYFCPVLFAKFRY